MSGKDNKKVIRLEIKDFENWGADAYQDVQHPSVEIGNVDWTLGAYVVTSEETNNVKHLGVYVECNKSSRSNLWSCNASIRFSLVKLNSNEKNEAYSMDFDYKFDKNEDTLDVPNFKNWQEAICHENRFVLDKTAVIEAYITVNNVVGIHEKILETFEKPRENLTDVVLIVEEKKVHVGKQILAQHSDYFNELFFSKGSSGEEEIVIEDVVHSHFVDFLNFIYPSHQVLTAENVGHVLKLADMFKVPYVLFKCERFLMSKDANGIPLVDKLKFAETYKLSVLQNHCLNELENTEDVTDLTGNPKYSSLSHVTRSALFEKLVDLVEEERKNAKSTA